MDGKNKPALQALSDLVEWYLRDREVELRIVPTRAVGWGGKVAPEFDFLYYLDGRRIADKALCMLMMIEFGKLNYEFNLPRIQSALNEHSWRYYVATVDYPAWLDAKAEKVEEYKRPVGRPRKTPASLRFEQVVPLKAEPGADMVKPQVPAQMAVNILSNETE